MNVMPVQRITIGSFDAKTHFSELLRKVTEGIIVDITKNGKKIATLQSPHRINLSEAQKAADRIKFRREAIEQKREKYGLEPVTQEMIKEWKNYGRKY